MGVARSEVTRPQAPEPLLPTDASTYAQGKACQPDEALRTRTEDDAALESILASPREPNAQKPIGITPARLTCLSRAEQRSSPGRIWREGVLQSANRIRARASPRQNRQLRKKLADASNLAAHSRPLAAPPVVERFTWLAQVHDPGGEHSGSDSHFRHVLRRRSRLARGIPGPAL